MERRVCILPQFGTELNLSESPQCAHFLNVMWHPIRSRRQEVLLAYADALEAELREACERWLGEMPSARHEGIYQPLKVERYERVRSEAIDEGVRGLRVEGEARNWEDRERQRQNKKDPPRPAKEILARGGIILGDPGGGKSELLRQETLRRLADLRKQICVGECAHVAVPLLLQIPRHLNDKADEAPMNENLRRMRRDVWMTETAPGETMTDQHRMVVLAGLYQQCGELGLRSRAVELIRQIWLGWRREDASPWIALDSWDEVSGERRRSALVPLLCALLREDRAVMASRVVGFNEMEFPHGYSWRLLPLNLSEAQTIVRARLGDSPSARHLNQQLQAKPQVAALASNPLALTLIIKVFRNDNPLELPEKRSQLYDRFINDLLGEPEARRRGRDPWTWESSRQEKRRFLEHLAWFGYPKVGRTLKEFGGILRQVCEDKEISEVFNDVAGETQGGNLSAKIRNILVHEHGILVPYGSGEVAFTHKVLLDYMAASFLARIINEEKFEEVPILRSGRRENVSLIRFLESKGWCPRHFEMIALLGGIVDDPERLVWNISLGIPDDIRRNRRKLGLAVASEMKRNQAMSSEIVQFLTEEALGPILLGLKLFNEDNIFDSIPVFIGFCDTLAEKLVKRFIDMINRREDFEPSFRWIGSFIGRNSPKRRDLINDLFLSLEHEKSEDIRVSLIYGVDALQEGLIMDSPDYSYRLMCLAEDDPSERVRQLVIRLLGTFGGRSERVPYEIFSRLVFLYEKNAELRFDIANTIQEISGLLDGSRLKIMVDIVRLSECGNSEKFYLPLSYAIASLGGDESGDIQVLGMKLVQMLESANSRKQREFIALSLRQFCKRHGRDLCGIKDSLRSILLRGESKDGRRWIVRSYAHVGVESPESAQSVARDLMSIFRVEGSPSIREAIVIAVADLSPSLGAESSKVFSGLMNAFDEEDEGVRWTIAHALSTVQKGGVYDANSKVEALIYFLDSEESEYVRGAIVVSLADLGSGIADAGKRTQIVNTLVGHLVVEESECMSINILNSIEQIGMEFLALERGFISVFIERNELNSTTDLACEFFRLFSLCHVQSKREFQAIKIQFFEYIGGEISEDLWIRVLDYFGAFLSYNREFSKGVFFEILKWQGSLSEFSKRLHVITTMCIVCDYGNEFEVNQIEKIITSFEIHDFWPISRDVSQIITSKGELGLPLLNRLFSNGYLDLDQIRTAASQLDGYLFLRDEMREFLFVDRGKITDLTPNLG